LLHNLHAEDIKRFLEESIRKDLAQDPLFEKSLEIGKHAKNMFDSMNAYFSEIFDFHDGLRKELYSDMFCSSRMFIDSDLPLSFVKTLEDSILAEIDYIDVIDKRIRKERFDLIRYRSNRPKFERVCENHNRWIEGFDRLRSRVENVRVKLIWYVDFNNSESVEEIFENKTMAINLLDKSILDEFLASLQRNASEMETVITPAMDIPTFLQHETDEGTRALLGMMQILSGQEGNQ
jgi:hypothetical protein